jgi:energy-coupling factor transporter ATP-binding protein EcfA2
MKIRKIIFKDFRSFRGVKEISFLDPLTDEPRPMTVIVGSNGTGKTTILDTIEKVSQQAIYDQGLADLQPQHGGYGCLYLQLTSDDLGNVAPKQPVLKLGFGWYHDLLSLQIEKVEAFDWAYTWVSSRDGTDWGGSHPSSSTFIKWKQAARAMSEGNSQPLTGGVIYFPHTRDIAVRSGGPIEPPPDEPQWLFRFAPQNQWIGSLEHLWVWQNYLDLEEGKTNRENLAPFVSMVEDVLGEGRKITIHKGRVWVPPQWAVATGSDEKVRIDQLPSGERQVLLLFGELARRLRRGAIVMIDEPEISLHPTMQRLVVAKLRRLAREWDLQVILATHSMEIVHAVSPTEVINLDYLPPVEHQVIAQTEGVAAG